MKGAPRARRWLLAAMGLSTAWSLGAWTRPVRAAAARPDAALALQQPERGAPGPESDQAARAPTRFEERAAEYERRAKIANEQREDNQPPPPMNWTEFGGEAPPFVAMLINFGIMVAGYYLLGRRPIGAALQNRRDTIAKDIEEAHRMKEEAEARARTYQAKLQRLEEDARSAREALQRAGEAERQRIVDEADAKAERIRRDAEFVLEQELKQVRLDLWREAADAAVAAAAEILTQRTTPADQDRLAEDYLEELRGLAGAPASSPRRAAP